MAYTGVEYLDTQKLLDAANKVDGCIKEYKSFTSDYNGFRGLEGLAG
jgi:hypothetical protein